MKTKYLIIVLLSLLVLPLQNMDARPHHLPMPKEGETMAFAKRPKEELSFFAIRLMRVAFDRSYSINKEGLIILSGENFCDTIQIKESAAPYTFIRPSQTNFKKGELKFRIETEGYEPYESSIIKVRIPFELTVLMKPCK